MNITKILDAKGLACPMPMVRTKKAIDTIQSGEMLEVLDSIYNSEGLKTEASV